ncbi:NADH-quinone oxidoreductase subunit N [Wolbachia pipientis]|uniref:NADH-quinone oxidoreductase subunit N n=1 Tax=Wolbachia pipientis TaxID=955 RepID=A0A1E7QJS0_WOLPI|nr:NADH-quinone oxidoreductase subunit N [Wolbachia pipientis]OEY86627.1 NADH-quinone oxidoreductase subunit N [Wolbachia pipientis]
MDYIHIFPETFFIVSLLVLLLLGIVVKPRIIHLLVLVCAVITLVLLIIKTLLGRKHLDLTLFNSLLRLDIYVELVQVFVLTSGIAVLLLLNFSKQQYKYEFSILIAFALFAMLALISTNNLISFYLAFELMSIPLYVLACFNQNSRYACEAGVKYFTLGSLSSCIMLYGISLLYGYTGETDFTKLSEVLQGYKVTDGMIFGLICIFISLCFKLAIAPFHMWAPDVYQGAPTIVTAFLSTTPKAVLIALFMKFVHLVTSNLVWQYTMLCMSALSVLISALCALRQRNLKRLLAYSSIGHIGHMFAVLSIGYDTYMLGVVISVFVYLVIYIATSIGLFAYLIVMDDDDCTIESLSGIGKIQPVLAFGLSILLFSMSGIPPLAGFFTKIFIYTLLIASEFIVVPLIMIAASVISCYYYLSIIKVIYFDKAGYNKLINPGKGLSFIIISAVLINVLLPPVLVYIIYCNFGCTD